MDYYCILRAVLLSIIYILLKLIAFIQTNGRSHACLPKLWFGTSLLLTDASHADIVLEKSDFTVQYLGKTIFVKEIYIFIRSSNPFTYFQEQFSKS